MEFACEKDNVREIDSTVKNRWRWDWLEDDLMKQYLRKLKSPGQAFCVLCNRVLMYKGGGKKDLKKHMNSPPHLLAMKTVKTNYSLESMIIGQKATETSAAVRPVVPVNDRQLNQEAMVLGFAAEHSLPFSLVPNIVTLAQNLAKDQKALSQLKLDRTTASYKMTHGLSPFFMGQLQQELKETFFSLNLDESTNANQDKIVACLVSFYSEEAGEIIVRHLESFKVVKATAQMIYENIVELFEKYELPWGNLISVLLDSCNTMRGKKSGLETLLRKKAPNLLDIDGDSVHHAHNIAKSFTSEFGYHLEGLFNTVHSDFLWSSDFRVELKTICEILKVKYTVPERFLTHRFLSAYNLSVDTYRLFQPLTIFYYSFLSTFDQNKYKSTYDKILESKHVSVESKEELTKISQRLKKKIMTKDGKERKEKVIGKLFDHRRKTRMLLSFYMHCLEPLKAYAVLFQTKAPMVHILHDSQFKLARQFLASFLRPEFIPSKPKDMKALTITEEMVLPARQMLMGSPALKIVNAVKENHQEIVEALGCLKKAYLKSGLALLKKMPIDSLVLQCFSSLDPSAKGHSLTLKLMKKLPQILPQVLSTEEVDSLEKEIHQFQCDPTLPELSGDTRIDHWWASITTYPHLQKIALASMSCFHGPMVEGTFNVMGDIMDSRTTSLNTDSVNAIQNVKSALKSKKVSSIDYFKREEVLYSQIKSGLVPCMSSAGMERRKRQLSDRMESDRKRKALNISDNRKTLSKQRANEIIALCAKKARTDFIEDSYSDRNSEETSSTKFI